MKGDFSRDSFDKAKHFSRVLMQQGRVQLDADWNEQVAILLHYMRTLAADLIGPFGGPEGDQYGFKITGNKTTDDFSIGKGRYYVDGILCENEQEITYKNQKNFPNQPPDLMIPELNTEEAPYLVYLDVWERHVTPIEDDDIREKALNGADTATRAQIVWQVKVLNSMKYNKSEDVHNDWATVVETIEKRAPNKHGCLEAQIKEQEETEDPCTTSPASKYRGPENQLYRIEIHQGSSDKNDKPQTPTFKWSRDNGSIASLVEKVSDTEFTVQKPRGFDAGQWVEFSTDETELHGLPGSLAKLYKVDGNTLILDPTTKVLFAATKVRRWDHKTPEGDIKIEKRPNVGKPVPGETDWINLEYGLKVKFKQGIYRTGDYWLIPARVATGDIEWPPQPPHGIRHHYAPLAILTVETGKLKVDTESDGDCRCSFPPQTQTSDCNSLDSYGDLRCDTNAE